MKALEWLLNFRTNKATMNDTNGQVKTLKENVLGVGTSINKVHDQLSKFAHSQKWANISSLTSNVAAGFANVAGNLKAAFSGAFNFMDQFATKGDKIAKTSRLVGLSVKDYQGLSFAADRSGLSIETLDGALKKFNVNLGKAKSGDKSASKMFEALLPKDVSEYESSKDVILDIADAYKNLSAEQKAMVGSQVFGKAGMQMAEMFANGSEGVQGLLDQYQELGGGLTDEAAASAEQFKDDVTNMNVTLESMKILIGSELMPAFSELFKEITKYFTSNKGELRKMISDMGTKLVASIRDLIPMIPSIIGGFVSIAGVVASIVEYLGPIKSIIGGALIASLGSIISIVTALVGIIGGPAVAAIGLVVAAVVSWGIAIKSIYDNWDMLKSFIMDDVVGGIVSAFQGAFDFISNTFNSIISTIAGGIKSVLSSIPLVGSLFGDSSEDVSEAASSSIAESIQGSSNTTTNRFAVDFKNMPKGVSVTPPPEGDFDFSYGCVMGGM